MNLVLRKASAADLPSMIELLTQLFSIEADFTPDAQNQVVGLHLLLTRLDTLVLIAEKEGIVVGMCTVQVLVSTAEGREVGLVEDVIVRADHRGHGIGSAMLEALEQWSIEQGLVRLQLLADQNNSSALSFYKSQGWATTQMINLKHTLRRS